jgi:hypothetical protein
VLSGVCSGIWATWMSSGWGSATPPSCALAMLGGFFVERRRVGVVDIA